MTLKKADPELFDSMSSSNPFIRATADDLRKALWEPTLSENPRSDATWSAFQWFFSLEDGSLGAITNHKDGGEFWNVLSVEPQDDEKILDAVIKHVQAAGFKISRY